MRCRDAEFLFLYQDGPLHIAIVIFNKNSRSNYQTGLFGRLEMFRWKTLEVISNVNGVLKIQCLKK